MKIEKLTDEQIEMFPYYVDKWIKIGTCTDPCDRIESKSAINEMYQMGGMPPPKNIVWTQSPLSMVLTERFIKNDSVRASVYDSVLNSVRASVHESVLNSVRASVGASVSNSVSASVGNSVRDSVLNSVLASVGDSVRASVGDSVRASVINSVGASVRNSVRDSVGDSVGASIRNSVGASVRGQHESWWLSYYDYFLNVCGLKKETEKLSGLFRLAKNTGWVLSYMNMCIVSERHNICELQDGVIHCGTGPAIAYSDGFAVYAINGVMVDKQIVMAPQTQTLFQIDGESNAEKKRIRIERFGWERYLSEKNATVIEGRGNEIEQTREVLMKCDDMQVLVCACPSTARVYAMEVDPACATVEQAQNYLSRGKTPCIIGAS